MAISVTSAPSVEPVTAAQVKEWLRVDSGDTSQDDRIDLLITAARQRVEAHLDRALITQTIQWDTSSTEGDPTRMLYIPRAPVQSLTSLIEYDDDAAGTSTTYSQGADSLTVVDTGSTIIAEVVDKGKLVPRNDAWTVSRKHKAMRLTYVAGYGAAATDVPAAIRQAIIRMAGTEYEAREDVQFAFNAVRLDDVTLSLLHPYRRGWM